MADPTGGKSKRPKPPPGARVVMKDGIQTVYQDPDDLGVGGGYPASVAEDVDSLGGTIGDIAFGSVFAAGPEGSVSMEAVGAYRPGGASRTLASRFRAVGGQPDRAEPAAGQGPTGERWAVHILGDDPRSGLVSGTGGFAGEGLFTALFQDPDGLFQGVVPGTVAALLPAGSATRESMVTGSVLGVAALPMRDGTGAVSVVLSVKKKE